VAVGQYAEDFGYDLDAEGLPLSDEDRIREGRGTTDGAGLPTGDGDGAGLGEPVADADRPGAVPAAR
jgi:hypothetical protein